MLSEKRIIIKMSLMSQALFVWDGDMIIRKNYEIILKKSIWQLKQMRKIFVLSAMVF